MNGAAVSAATEEKSSPKAAAASDVAGPCATTGDFSTGEGDFSTGEGLGDGDEGAGLGDAIMEGVSSLAGADLPSI